MPAPACSLLGLLLPLPRSQQVLRQHHRCAPALGPAAVASAQVSGTSPSLGSSKLHVLAPKPGKEKGRLEEMGGSTSPTVPGSGAPRLCVLSAKGAGYAAEARDRKPGSNPSSAAGRLCDSRWAISVHGASVSSSIKWN